MEHAINQNDNLPAGNFTGLTTSGNLPANGMPCLQDIDSLYPEYLETSDAILADVHSHLEAALDLLGVEWRQDRILDSGMAGVYIRTNGEAPTLMTGDSRCPQPGALDPGDNAADLIMAARAIATHLLTTVYSQRDSVQEVYAEQDTGGIKTIHATLCEVDCTRDSCAKCKQECSCRA